MCHILSQCVMTKAGISLPKPHNLPVDGDVFWQTDENCHHHRDGFGRFLSSLICQTKDVGNPVCQQGRIPASFRELDEMGRKFATFGTAVALFPEQALTLVFDIL